MPQNPLPFRSNTESLVNIYFQASVLSKPVITEDPVIECIILVTTSIEY